MTDPKIAALVDLGNAAYKAVSIAPSSSVAMALRDALGEGYFEQEHITVSENSEGFWLHFGPHVCISLDSILDGRGPMVTAKARAFVAEMVSCRRETP